MSPQDVVGSRRLSGVDGTRPTLCVFTDGRGHYLERTLRSARHLLRGDWAHKLIVDDSGDPDYTDTLTRYTQDGFEVVRHSERRGLSGAIRTAWAEAPQGWIFHLEDDFTFTRAVHVDDLIAVCQRDGLAQMVLQRQPWSPPEVNAGGVILSQPHNFTARDRYEVHNDLFWLNPCVYPQWVRDVGWPAGGGETEFTHHLTEAYPDVLFGVWGHRDGAPAVWHIGDSRAAGWRV